MRLEPIRPTPETTERLAYQAPKLENHNNYTAIIGGGGSFGAIQNPGEFWDNSKFWEDLGRPSF